MNLENAKNIFLTYPNGDKITFEAVIENEVVMLKCFANNTQFTKFPVENLPLIAKVLNDMFFSIVHQNNENEKIILN